MFTIFPAVKSAVLVGIESTIVLPAVAVVAVLVIVAVPSAPIVIGSTAAVIPAAVPETVTFTTEPAVP